MRGLLGILLLLLGLRAEASDWVPVSQAGDDSGVVYVDLDSLRWEHQKVKAWVKYLMARPTKEFSNPSKVFSSERSLLAVDCSARAMGFVQTTRFASKDLGGEVVYQWSTDFALVSYKDVPPDSMNEFTLVYVCKNVVPPGM